MYQPSRGETVLVDLDPIEGHEQGGRRPALVVSTDRFNFSPAELVIVVPISRTDRKVRSHVRINPPEGGMQSTSYIMADQIRTVSLHRVKKPLGKVSASTMSEVEDRLRMLLQL